MKIYDISQEIFGCEVYPNDPAPEKKQINSMSNGDLYNLTAFSMCAHNGTHIDAPLHFLENGNPVDKIPLEKTIGYCYVAQCNGDINAETARAILNKAVSSNPDSAKRILIKGDAVITEESANVFAQEGIYLIATESQSVGPINSPMAVHKILLQKDILLLEGVRLAAVPEGTYFLNAAPLNLGGCEGAPCRAVLVDLD
ncbi:MAG: cyclase [Ruminococcaceae bacterium]|nr:cyclase [Oscillospiraceae bacterium]